MRCARLKKLPQQERFRHHGMVTRWVSPRATHPTGFHRAPLKDTLSQKLPCLTYGVQSSAVTVILLP
jgi:hypothetical protein